MLVAGKTGSELIVSGAELGGRRENRPNYFKVLVVFLGVFPPEGAEQATDVTVPYQTSLRRCGNGRAAGFPVKLRG